MDDPRDHGLGESPKPVIPPELDGPHAEDVECPHCGGKTLFPIKVRLPESHRFSHMLKGDLPLGWTHGNVEARMKYLVWSFEHDAWWGPNHCGYTNDIDKAGRYTAQEAGSIHTNSIFLDEVAILESLALEHGHPKFHPIKGRQAAKGPYL